MSRRGLIEVAGVVAGLALVLGLANVSIWRYERVVSSGRPVLLELAPVDPRSLIQGDYTRLRYADTALPPPGTAAALPRHGTLVLRLDAHGVGRFARVDDGTPLAADEVRLRYRRLDDPDDAAARLRIAPNAFFFQEGRAGLYENARYGVLHVDATGRSVLVGLADEAWGHLGAPAP